MSIFDKVNIDNEKLNKYIEKANRLIINKDDYYNSLNLYKYANQYIVQILELGSYEIFVKNIDNLDFIEFFINFVIYFICYENFIGDAKFNYQKQFFLTLPNGDIEISEIKVLIKNTFDLFGMYIPNINEILGLLNVFLKVVEEEGLEFIKIDRFKYKLISKDVKQLSDQIKNKVWREEINKFFLEYKNHLTEKEKILGWFANHIEGNVREIIEKELLFFDKKQINSLMKRLHNIYKHFNSKKVAQNKEEYDAFKKKSDSEKHNQMDQDMWFIVYLLIEYEKFPKN